MGPLQSRMSNQVVTVTALLVAASIQTPRSRRDFAAADKRAITHNPAAQGSRPMEVWAMKLAREAASGINPTSPHAIAAHTNVSAIVGRTGTCGFHTLTNICHARHRYPTMATKTAASSAGDAKRAAIQAAMSSDEALMH